MKTDKKSKTNVKNHLSVDFVVKNFAAKLKFYEINPINFSIKIETEVPSCHVKKSMQ